MPQLSAEFTRPVAMRLALPCDLLEVRAAAAKIRDFLAAQGWPPDDLMACELALVEACNNAVKYTPPASRAHPIVVDIISDEYCLEIRVTDHTLGFDLPEEISLPEEESECGRGLFLIQSLMDRLNYFRSRSENTLVMSRSRPAAAAGAAPRGAVSSLEQKVSDQEQVITQMVEELSSCYESLSAIFRYGAEQVKTGDLKPFAHRLLTDMLQIVSADWFVLRMATGDGRRLEGFAASARLDSLLPLSLPTTLTAGLPVEAEATLAQQDVWFNRNAPLPATDPLARFKPGSLGLVHPFFVGDSLMGTLTVGREQPARMSHPPQPDVVFTAAQTNVINTFADFLAIQVVNARLQEQQVRSRLVERDLEIAKNIQRSLLVKSVPKLPDFDLVGYCESAHQVGGDFFDVIKVTDRSMLLVIADVMGKGIPAAMFAAVLRTLVRATPELSSQPAALLSRVNRMLFKELSEVEMFITAQLSYLDAHDGKMVVANAGHCPLLVASGSGGKLLSLSPEGMPLGILPDTVFHDETVDLPESARVLMYTDGLTEALNAKGQRFGQDRLLQWLKTNAVNLSSAEEMKRDLVGEISRFQANTILNDDQTFLIMTSAK